MGRRPGDAADGVSRLAVTPANVSYQRALRLASKLLDVRAAHSHSELSARNAAREERGVASTTGGGAMGRLSTAIVILLLFASDARAIECQADMQRSHSYWAWRLIDGRGRERSGTCAATCQPRKGYERK